MSRSLSLSRVTAAISLALLILTGCGGTAPVSVTGKITMPAKTKLVDTDTVTLVFHPEEGGEGKSENATASPKDLTFTTKLVPGKYKISVNVQVYAGTQDGATRSKELAAQFGSYSMNSTPLKCEVTKEQPQTINIDLDKKSVGK